MMIVSLNCQFLTVSSPVSVGTFVKHFPNPRKPVFRFIHMPAGKTIFTPTSFAAAALDNPHFPALTSHQRHQIGLYMDSLLQWNQVIGVHEQALCLLGACGSVVGSIGLQNAQVMRERAENLGQNPDFREGFDVSVARAVAERRVLAEYCLPLVHVGGLFLAAKGHDPQEEITRAERAIHLMGASILSWPVQIM